MHDESYEDDNEEQDYDNVVYEMAGRALLIAALDQGIDIESLVQGAKGDILNNGQSRIAGHPSVSNACAVLDDWLQELEEELEED